MFTKPFKQLSKHDANIAGGKGASLGEMINAGIPVPDGFVVLSTTFDKFLELTDINIEIDSILSKVKHNEVGAVENASKQIQALILNADIPQEISEEIETEFKKLNCKYVAVRSSATAEDSASAAWAGQLDSFLNTTKETLLENVKRCFASLFTPRAIFYRFEKELNEQKISVAVVVQKMVNSDISGIAFSVHPVTEDYNQIIIEAGFGLGEAIVSGQITPDSYVVTKDDLNILDKNVYTQDRGIFRDEKNGGSEWINISKEQGEKQCLSDKQIIELAKLIINIENHYTFPCDIEWAMEDNKFYIVQSRPITTLKNKEIKKEKIVLEKMFSREKSLMYMKMWNVSEDVGYKKFINYDLENSLFIFDANIKKTSVWYNEKENEKIVKLLSDMVQRDGFFIDRIIKCLDDNWKIIYPYLSKQKKVKTISEFERYYQGITDWWSAMNTVYPLINIQNISKKASETFLQYREFSERYTGEMDSIINNFWDERFREKESKKLVPFLLLEEAIKLDNKELSDIQLKLIKNRANGFGIYKSQVYDFDNLMKIIEENSLYLNKIDSNSKENIIGITAYPGCVRGVVKKIILKNDINNFREGEILVAETTYPDHVFAMKKAAAFVTDEGGITCHAAIVARELKKPCIIGTKIATQVLQDGDEVEVDADSGVVRILNKKISDGIDIKKFKESIKDREYTTQQGNISVAIFGNMCNAIQKEFISVYDYKHVQPILTMQKGTGGICFFDLEMYRDFSRVSYSRIQDSVYNLPEYKDYQELSKIINDEYNSFSIPKDIAELKKKIANYFILVKKYLVSNLYCEAVDHQIVKELAEKTGVKNIEKFVETSILPTKMSFVGHQNQLLLDGADISWSFANYFAAPTTENRLELLNKKRKEINRREVEDEIKKIKKIAENNHKLVDELLKEVSEEQKRVIEFVQASINVRDERKEFILKLYTIISDSLRALAREYNISYDLISTIAEDEMEKLGDPSFIKVLEERFKKGVAMISGGESHQISVVDYDLSKNIIFGDTGETDILNGICANKGFCKGMVRVIVSEKDFSQFQNNEILVTGMTRAEYVPLMRKAGAIITDEGGVTCHAAIVSRELGIPCIIGTKIATQVLKDGDEVEVNADNGTIRIVKRN